MGAGRGAAGSPQVPRPEPSAGAKVAGGTRRAQPPAPARGGAERGRELRARPSCGAGGGRRVGRGGRGGFPSPRRSRPLLRLLPARRPRRALRLSLREVRRTGPPRRSPRGKDTPEIPDEPEPLSCLGAGRCGSVSTAENLGAAPRPPAPAAQMVQAGGGGTEHRRPHAAPHSGPGASRPGPCSAAGASAQGRDPAVVWGPPTGSACGKGPGTAQLWVRWCCYRDRCEENRETV